MTVGELIQKLSGLDHSLPVFVTDRDSTQSIKARWAIQTNTIIHTKDHSHREWVPCVLIAIDKTDFKDGYGD